MYTPLQPDANWLGRPPEQFRDLSLETRWELTRRHPTYLLAWRPALRYLQCHHFSDSQELMRHRAAQILLGSIGVAGTPVDPGTPAETILEGVGPEWLGGPVRPISLRALAIMLFTALPPDERLAVSQAFVRSASPNYRLGDDDLHHSRQMISGLEELQSLPFPRLDQFFRDQPLYYVQMEASQRSILTDMTDHIQRAHKRAQHEDRRTRVDDLPAALAVWDLREGWTGSNYEAAREKTLKEVSQELNTPLTTVASRYKAGFRYVTGLEFSPERWMRLKAPLIHMQPDEALGLRAKYAIRCLSGGSFRPVPESTLQGRVTQEDEAEKPGIVTAGSAIKDDVSLVDLRLDIEELAGKGWSDEHIAAELEESVETISAVRKRLMEFKEFRIS